MTPSTYPKGKDWPLESDLKDYIKQNDYIELLKNTTFFFSNNAMFHYLAFSHRSNAKWGSKLKMKKKKKSGRAGEEGGEGGEDSFALSLPPRLERSSQGDIL